MSTNSICSVCTRSTRSMVASSRTCGWARALVRVWRCSRVSPSASSIMLAISFIWLIGCQFTGLAFGIGASSGSGHDGLGGRLGAPAGRLEVAAIGNDVGVGQWRDARQFLVCHVVPGGPELIDDAADMDGVPDQHGVGKQAEAAGLVHHLLVVAGAEAAPVGEEQRLREDVAELAAVELQLDGVTQLLLVDVSQDVQRLHQPSELAERAGEAIGRI